MNFKEILELIDRVAESGITGVEIEQGGTKVRIEGKPSHPKVFTYAGETKPAESIPMAALPSLAPAPAAPPQVEAAAEASDAGLHVITSPIVGTFYRSPNPEAPAFVNVGDRVSKGQVICIIEAMKLMNEIESDVDGVIATIYPSNGQPVEYGEKLFAVKV
ncbi:MAG TPA: acetyl-CoA carboxylase biotin carboxyl carrier protein [Thermoanaerobaculia bacterium]|nr:acetyl-CoA carboxylase biotin carboxyl carrier protein [Thermoanaerobaculia bacterium]